MHHILLCLVALCLGHDAHAHETTSAGVDANTSSNASHILATHTVITASPTNYDPNLTNLDVDTNVYAQASSSDASGSDVDTVLVLLLTLGIFGCVSAAAILSFKLFLTWREHSEEKHSPRKDSRSCVLSISALSERKSRSREPTASGDERDPEAVRKESVLTEIWNDAETTHDLESGYVEHVTSKTHETDAITEAPSTRQRVGSTGYIEAIFAQYNQPHGDEDGDAGAAGQVLDKAALAALDVNDELYRSPTKKYRITVHSIDDLNLEPFDINQSFEEIAGSVTPPHQEHAEEHSLETHHTVNSESGDLMDAEERAGHRRSGQRGSRSVESVESVHGFEAEESVEESSVELVGPAGARVTATAGAGYVD